MLKTRSISLLCTILLLLSLSFNSSVYAIEALEDVTSNEVGFSNVMPLATPLWRTVLNYAFKLLKVNSPVDHPAVTNFGPQRDTVNTGSVVFNDGSNGFNTVKKDAYGMAGHVFEMWGNSQVLLPPWGGNIGVVLRAPNGSLKINRTVSHNQMSMYAIESGNTGYYEAYWNSTSKHKWRLWLGYWHFGDSLSATFNLVDSDDSSFKEIDFMDIGDKRYLVPSSTHVNNDFNNTNRVNSNHTVTFGELYDQFYDSKLDSLVDVAKDYQAGDTIIVNDSITDVFYIKEYDMTAFVFDMGDESFDIHFTGDLTNEYRIGQNINFIFQLLPVLNDEIFVVIDYNKMVEEIKDVPHIERFLLK